MLLSVCMAQRRVVAVLGGNAFQKPGEPLTMAGQFAFAREAIESLSPLLANDVDLLLGHGNGPQVGHMLIRVEEALGKAYALPLEVCVAESEGELGYVLAQTLRNACAERGVRRAIASVLTQVIVDPRDPAFALPSKPIGPFYEHDTAEALRAKGFVFREDAGRGYRRVVASPRPREVVEADVIATLLQNRTLVIAGGGGGVPVVEIDGRLHGVDAVVDKDHTAALLADAIDAELLVILTGVPCAYVHFGKPEQRPIGRVDATTLDRLALEGHFAPGSMGPKVEAVIAFASRPGRRAIICDPPSLARALEGEAGTIVTAGGEP